MTYLLVKKLNTGGASDVVANCFPFLAFRCLHFSIATVQNYDQRGSFAKQIVHKSVILAQYNTLQACSIDDRQCTVWFVILLLLNHAGYRSEILALIYSRQAIITMRLLCPRTEHETTTSPVNAHSRKKIDLKFCRKWVNACFTTADYRPDMATDLQLATRFSGSPACLQFPISISFAPCFSS